MFRSNLAAIACANFSGPRKATQGYNSPGTQLSDMKKKIGRVSITRMSCTIASAAAVALLLSCSIPACAQAARQPPVKNLGLIYVASMGESDKADEFRSMLGYELGQAGFKVTDFKLRADSILSGLLAIRPERGQSVARVTVFLKNKDGKTLWTGDFGATSKPTSISDSLRMRAEDVAAALKKLVGPPEQGKSGHQ